MLTVDLGAMRELLVRHKGRGLPQLGGRELLKLGHVGAERFREQRGEEGKEDYWHPLVPQQKATAIGHRGL